MMKSLLALLVLLVFNASTVVKADCGKCGDSDEVVKATTVDAHQSEDEGCPIAAAMEKLPKITFAVGEGTLCCEKRAAALAEKSGERIHYCVGELQFDAKADAQVALVEATEMFVSTFAEPHTCKTSGKITVADNELHCIFCARSLARKMNEAMDGVQMTYLVGQDKFACPQTAAKLAKEAGLDKQFVVGDEKTHCEQTARLNLAHAKYEAAMTVLTEATGK